jgi:hypothetical protein
MDTIDIILKSAIALLGSAFLIVMGIILFPMLPH